ncbi:MAG TPA: lysyl oxidase family protein [Longimicrobium sp.]|nr:lysyl oxidase family protein [Longimicrobium sp.]
MRTRTTVLSIAAFVVAAAGLATACSRDSTTINSPELRKLAQPGLDPPGNGHTQDLDGLPDLVVNTATTAHSWVVRQEEFVAGECSVEEGNIPTGSHKSLRFSVRIDNLGTADLYVGDPLRHMDPNGDGDYSDADGLFEFATCHKHFHFRNYARYDLLPLRADGTLGTPIQAKKRGFCMLDTSPAQNANGQPGPSQYLYCGNQRFHGNQGISRNWGDEYEKNLPGQVFVLDDPAEPAPPGRYVVRVTANPAFAETPGQPCPVKDAQGMCHMFAELSYANNVGDVVIEIPDRVGRIGVGPGQGDFAESLDSHHHPEVHGGGH